jgi:predicted GIY-YIG superfamily endonuclease
MLSKSQRRGEGRERGRTMKRASVVYLIHFNRPYKHARHYLGFSTNLDKRITDHLAGMGARLLEVVTEARIEWKLVRTWPGDRQLERRLKNRKDAPHICPICAGEKAMRRANNYREKSR